MTTLQFLEESEHALTVLFDAIWYERNEIEKLEPVFQALEAQVRDEYQQAESIAMNAEDPDDVMLATGRMWETYFGADKERHTVDSRLQVVKEVEDAHRFSRSSLAAAVLQIAKQAIGIEHGAAGWMKGRTIGTKPLGEIVRQARNQAMHWEEGNLSPSVLLAFGELNAVAPVKGFDAPLTRSLAFEVLETLGWKTVANMKADLGAL